MTSVEFSDSVRRVRSLLTPPRKVPDPILVILSGLPGSGKTTLAARLGKVLDAVVVESDLVRKVIFPKPTYSAEENRFVHAVARALMRYYLRTGHSVIADATNLAEWHRQMLRRLANLARAQAIVVQTSAPEEVIAARLHRRSARKVKNDFSDADWQVYQMLAKSVQPIRGHYIRVDTTRDLDKSIRRIDTAVRKVRRIQGRSSLSN